MSESLQDKLSLAAVYIRFLDGDVALANASAFLWKYEGNAFLISNWHNFTGRNPKTKCALHSTTHVPDHVECHFYKSRFLDGAKTVSYIPESFNFPLYYPDSRPRFFEHHLGSEVDVAALPIDLPEDVTPFFLNDQDFDDRIKLYPGQDVFIIGYPLGPITGNTLPLWKRGTIASEPYVLIDGLKKLYIDTATRPGMSGSFVFAQHTGLFSPTKSEMTLGSWLGSGRTILGVYSGRIGPHDFEAQVGIVWHREVIEELLSKKIIADVANTNP